MPEPISQSARILLQDGSIFSGALFGADRDAAGEVVFNTGMVGYPESLTDPSYRGQILVMTYPLIGNYGVPGKERADDLPVHFESDQIQVRGLVTADYSDAFSHWNAAHSLGEWMDREGIPGVNGVDTRALTVRLREHGTMPGKIIRGDAAPGEFEDPNLRNLVSEVSVSDPVEYPRGATRVVLIDCGVKNTIIRSLLRRDITVLRVPWDYDFLGLKPDGVLISNGPGDPAVCVETIENVRRAFSRTVPVFGICLGLQILGLAAGARTYKLKYGHRSQNQPCEERGTNRCYITSQNHGYAIDAATLPEDWHEWFTNTNDRTNEGIIHVSRPWFGAQFHPEASPGPDDTEFLFDMFIRAVKA